MTAITADRRDARPDAAQVGRLDLYIILMAIGLGIVVVTGISSPRATFVSRDLYTALNGLVVGVAAMAALAQWNHYTEERSPAGFLLSAALTVLAIANGARLIITVLGVEDRFGFSAADPGQAPVYAWFLTRLFAGGLFGLAGIALLRQSTAVAPLGRLAAAVGVVVAIVSFPLAAAVEPVLPKAITFGAQTGEGPFGVAVSVTPAYVVVNLLLAALFFIAAARFRLVYSRDGSRRVAFLTLALIIGGFSQIQAGFSPAMFVGIISGGDPLRAIFYGFLVLAFQADTRATLRDLRDSHARLEELRDSEVVRAILEERARLAREVHDGLTQELWLAKLQFGEIAEGLADRHPEFKGPIDDVRNALDSAIAEARLAIVALSASAEATSDFVATLRTYVEDVGDRLGVPVTTTISGDVPILPARTSAEVTRIVQEALTNVRKHAHATQALVKLESSSGTVRITVEDDGQGFDLNRQSPGHGLASMQERAAAIGGSVTFEQPGRGSRVVLAFPLPTDSKTGEL
jgi:signal transduction histidine kinase